jgi:aerobic carbon-monoxide dehydrogenase small subunit
VMRGIAMANEGCATDEEQIRRGLCGNMCRCTGYEGIVRAIGDGLARMQEAKARDA